jgi:hypothetical protein
VLRDFPRLSYWPHHLLGVLAALCIVAAMRVYGTGLQEFVWSNIATATVHTLLAYPLFTIGAQIAIRYAPSQLPFALTLAIGCFAVAPLFGVLSPTLSWIFNVMPRHIEAEPTRSWLVSFIQDRYFSISIGYAVVGTPLWLLINLQWYKVELGVERALAFPKSRSVRPQFSEPERLETSPPLFVQKLPVEKRGPVWAVTAEQHYLRVYTSRGNDLILMRFSDALEQLRPYDGLQIHRSHWVAQAGVQGLETENKRLHVHLKNGVKLPVSRPNYAAAKATLGESGVVASETAGA